MGAEVRRLRDRQQLNNGFGAALSQAFEIAITPVLFGVLGWLVDRWLGTGWVFTAALATFGVIGTFVRTWFAYDARMKAHEADQPWNRGRA